MNRKITFTDILLPTDFSKLSGNALITAIEMCRRHNATLHVMHVVGNRLMVAPPEANMPVFYVMPEMEGAGRRRLKSLASKVEKKHEIEVRTHLAFGIPANAIRDKAIELNCQLVIMGTHGSSGIRELFMSSTARSLIKNSTIPVLTIPAKRVFKSFKKILFPIWAANGIMHKYRVIESVIEKNESELFILGLSLTKEILNTVDRKKELLELGRSLGTNSIRFRSEYHVCNNYAKKVLSISKREKADLIVINADMDCSWSQLLMGPYSQQIINHTEIPVLNIRIPGKADKNKPLVVPYRLTEAV